MSVVADAGRTLLGAAEPTIKKVTIEADRFWDAAGPRIAELAEHVDRARSGVEPTLRRVSADVSRFREAGEPKFNAAVERIEDARVAAQPALARAQVLADAARAWTREHGPAIAEVVLGVQYFAAHAHVENWADLEADDWEKAIELMRADDGVPLAWIPPSHIVKELVDANDHAARDVVLLARSDEISGVAASARV